MLKLFKSLDLMGKSFQLSFNGDYQYKTYTGALISLILTVLLVIGTIYFGKEVIVKSDPFVTPTFQTYNKFDKQNLTTDNLFVMVGVEDPRYVYYVDETIFNMTGQISGYDFNEKTNSPEWMFKYFKPVICSTLYNNSIIEKSLPEFTYDLNMFWCIPKIKENEENVYVEGFYGAKSLRIVQFILSKCVNSTENNNSCKPEEEMNKYLQGGIIAIQSNKFILDSKNLDTPLKKATVDSWQILNLNMEVNMFFYLKTLEFETDIGFLLPSLQEFKGYEYNDPKTTYIMKEKINDNVLARINFIGSSWGSKYLRKYEKIQEVVTKIGGLLKALVFIGSVISYMTSEIEMNNDILLNLTKSNLDDKSKDESVNEFSKKIISYNDNLTKKEDFGLIEKINNNEDGKNKHESSIKINDKIMKNNFFYNSKFKEENIEDNSSISIKKLQSKSKLEKQAKFENKFEDLVLNLKVSNENISNTHHVKTFFDSACIFLFSFCCCKSFKKKPVYLLNENLSSIVSIETILKNLHFINFLKSNIQLIDKEELLSKNYNGLNLFKEYSKLLYH